MTMCRGCGEREASSKSHIVPKSFFRNMDDGAGSLVEISTKAGHFKKRRPVGYYDRTILCRECEKVFGSHDDFGQSVLIRRAPEFSPIVDGSKPVGFQLNDVDGERFKRFLVSVLWRASVSTLPQFSMAGIGPHEVRARAISWNESFSSRDEFAFIGMRYFENELSDVMLNPHPVRNAGINFMCLYIPGYKFWLKVDGRRMNQKLGRFNIVDTNTLVLFAEDMQSSKEYGGLLDAVRTTGGRS